MDKKTLYVGLNDKDTKLQRIDTMEATKIATNIICNYADGCTIYNAAGIYKHENGELVIENTLKIELIECHIETVKTIIAALKAALNQESIILQTETIVSEFV